MKKIVKDPVLLRLVQIATCPSCWMIALKKADVFVYMHPVLFTIASKKGSNLPLAGQTIWNPVHSIA